jgi:hypothetical protein
MRATILFGLLGFVLTQTAMAQISISSGGQDVRIGSDGGVNVKGAGADVRVGAGNQVSVGGGNQVSSSAGEIAPGANIEGVTIINGKLWIDGKEIPPGVKSYKSPKTGMAYKIERNGKNISVTGTD